MDRLKEIIFEILDNPDFKKSDCDCCTASFLLYSFGIDELADYLSKELTQCLGKHYLELVRIATSDTYQKYLAQLEYGKIKKELLKYKKALELACNDLSYDTFNENNHGKEMSERLRKDFLSTAEKEVNNGT